MKVYIITGASKGIGKATAIKLSNENPNDLFIILARDIKKLEETKKLMHANAKVIAKEIDLSDTPAIINYIKYVGEEYGRIDYLINIAGFVNPKSLLETTIENFEMTYKINILSVFVLTREVVRFMKRTGGKILNVASTAGMSSRPGWSAYSSSKAALISFSKTMSDELEEYGIKSYVISPGRCATDLRKLLAPEEDPSTIMQPEEVADVISNLMGIDGNNLDGQNIIIRKQL
jgi:3-oxoacyl-[acyl-carrier protein] reductase